MMGRVKSGVSLALKLVVAGALLVFMVRSGALDLSRLWDLITPMHVILATGLCGFGVVLSAWRWIFLLRTRGFDISLRYGLSLYLIGMFFNYALPGSVSGDLVRGYYLVRDNPQRKLDAALSILIDRILGLYSFFILALVAMLYDIEFVLSHEKIRWVATLSVMIFLGMTVFFVLSFSQRLFRLSRLRLITSRVHILHRLVEGFQHFGRDRKTIVFSLMVSVAAQAFSLGFFALIAYWMNESVITWQSILFAVPLGFVVTAVPISPAGVGVGQVAFLYLFQTYLNSTTTFGANAITAYQLTVAIWAAVGALVYIQWRKPQDTLNFEVEVPTT